MNFYTLTYDADLPAVQQVNVPTNSDYKIGMKVKRNGAVQSIKPSEFTVYTGEINVIPPTDWEGAAVSVANASSNIIVAYAPATTEALNGKVVKAKDVRFEASYDSGATWEEVSPLGLVGYLKINDKSAGTNNFVAQMDPRENKWQLLSGGEVVGETPEITMPQSALQVQMVSLPSNWGFTSYPCQFRVVLPYGGYEERVTYPVDPEKTNGYVTITKASGDDASFKQLDIHLDHGYDFNDYVKQTGLMTDTGKYDFPDTLTVESLGITGQVLTLDNISWGFKKQAGSPVDVDDIDGWNTPATWMSQNDAFRWPNGNVAVRVVSDKIGLFDEDGNLIEQTDKVVLNPVWHLSYLNRGLRGTVGNYYVIAFQFQFGTPFTADFKLNVNTFKSQQGDIAETVAEMPEVKVDGTYADGTTFSYDFCIK